MLIHKTPAVGTPINFGHPLSKEMIASYLMNEKKGYQASDYNFHNPFSGRYAKNAKNGGSQSAQFVQYMPFSNGKLGLYLTGSGVMKPDMDSSSLITNRGGSPGPGTWSIWVVFYSIATQSANYLFSDFPGGFSSSGALLQARNVGGFYKAKFSWSASSVEYGATGTTTLTNDKLYHIVGTRSGEPGNWTAKIYVNSMLEGTTSGITVDPLLNDYINSWTLPIIGGHFSGSPCNAYISTAQFWKRALNENEVRSLYLNPYQMYFQRNSKAYDVGAASLNTTNFFPFM